MGGPISHRTTLAAVLLCPLASIALSSLSGWSIPLPDGYQLTKRDQPSVPGLINDPSQGWQPF